jgi:hypothetical protein
MKKTLLVALLVFGIDPAGLFAQVPGQVVGTQCWINGTLVGGFPAGYTCPSTSNSSSSSANSQYYGAISQAGYQLGYAFGRWLFGGGSNRQQQLQQQQMMEELARREAEAERRHQLEEARRITAMYNRLYASLKLSGLPDLRLKGVSGGPGLTLKLGDDAAAAPPKRAPGFYTDANGKIQLHGIDGLPGIYADGDGRNTGLQNSTLTLKTGEAAEASSPSPLPPTETGLQLRTGEVATTPQAPAAPSVPPAPPSPADFSKMTPQQLADAAEAFSKLPPEEQQRLMAMAQKDAAAAQPGPPAPPSGPSGPGQTGAHWEAQPAAPASVASTQPPQAGEPAAPITAPTRQAGGQAQTPQAAAPAPGMEQASAQARVGFDTPGGPGAVPLDSAHSTPAMLRGPGAEASPGAIPATPPAPPSPGATTPGSEKVREDLMQLLFPATPSHSPFPPDPNPPLLNPLREEAKVQQQLKAWDDWALQRAIHLNPAADKSFPVDPGRAMLDADAVKDYAPELLPRYHSDPAFRANVDARLESADQYVALDYYQGLANAHKAAILEYQAELEKLAAAGKIDKLTPLEDQFREHPERRAIVQAVRDRVNADEQAAEEKARAEGLDKLHKQYQFVFQLVRGQTQ